MNPTIAINNGGGLDQLALIEKELKTPAAGEIQIRWHATSLNYHDYLVAIGGLKTAEGRIPMSDGAGEVTAVGAGVTKWNVGDKVMSLFFPNWINGVPTREKTSAISGETFDGYACHYSCFSENSVTRIPANYSYAEAATLPCAALTAWRALVVEGKIKSGDSVLIEGTGGMSIFALQIARMAGAEVFATTGSNEKIEILKSLGATAVVNYKEDVKWGKTIYKMTGGGVDHVIDVGGSATMNQSIDAVKIYGNIYSIGILGGPKGEVVFPKLFFKQVHLTGLAVGSAEMQEDMVKAFEVNNVKPILDQPKALAEMGKQSFELGQLADAFRYQETGRHFGKITVEW